jgi:6-phosphogluconolactonase
MPSSLYVCLQDEDKIAVFAIDADSGRLMRQPRWRPLGAVGDGDQPGPACAHLGHRAQPAISSFRIDQNTGVLTPQGTVSAEHAPTFLATDRTGRFLLSAYYQGGYAAVHPLAADGAVGAPALDRQTTATGAHAISADRSNRYAFVPHIARLNDNVLEPPKENPGPNVIFQFKFDAQTGRLGPNTPLRVEQAERLGPRHYCVHPTQDIAYFSNEQGCSVTAYRLDPATGVLSAVQTISTLPEGYTARNTCSQIHLTPSGQFLYVGNRGHNSIAGFAVDTTGRLAPIRQASTEPVPSAFCLDPPAVSSCGRLGLRPVGLVPHNGETGALTPLASPPWASGPGAVAARLGD